MPMSRAVMPSCESGLTLALLQDDCLELTAWATPQAWTAFV